MQNLGLWYLANVRQIVTELGLKAKSPWILNLLFPLHHDAVCA